MSGFAHAGFSACGTYRVVDLLPLPLASDDIAHIDVQSGLVRVLGNRLFLGFVDNSGFAFTLGYREDKDGISTPIHPLLRIASRNTRTNLALGWLLLSARRYRRQERTRQRRRPWPFSRVMMAEAIYGVIAQYPADDVESENDTVNEAASR